MDEEGARRAGAGQTPQRWAEGSRPPPETDLRRSRETLEKITEKARTQRSVDPGDVGHVRTRVYWHLRLLASELRPISDNVRVRLPRTPEDVDQIELDVRPLLADIVGLFGSKKNIVYFVDDDEAGTTAEQIRQVVELQENLSAAIADYLDVVEGVDGGGARRSKVRREFAAAFRQLQDKLDLVVGELQGWEVEG